VEQCDELHRPPRLRPQGVEMRVLRRLALEWAVGAQDRAAAVKKMEYSMAVNFVSDAETLKKKKG
jgi:hypothetical protein